MMREVERAIQNAIYDQSGDTTPQGVIEQLSEAGFVIGTWAEVLSLVRDSIVRDIAKQVRAGEQVQDDTLAAHKVIEAMIAASQPAD